MMRLCRIPTNMMKNMMKNRKSHLTRPVPVVLERNSRTAVERCKSLEPPPLIFVYHRLIASVSVYTTKSHLSPYEFANMILNNALRSLVPFGLFLRRIPQHGQLFPCYHKKIWHTWHLFCPNTYLFPFLFLFAL